MKHLHIHRRNWAAEGVVMQNGACMPSSGKFPGAKRERERGHVLKCLRMCR